MGFRSFAPQVTACPGCGRTTSTFFQEMAEQIQSHLRIQMPVWRERYAGVEDLRVAVMGCVVNGPGESKHADIGISLPGTFEEPKAPVFVDGALKVTLKGDHIVREFIDILGVIGTPQYMSPEQGQGLKIDGRSDEYSLAIVAYEMVIGRPPFEPETPLAIVLKHITDPLTPPASVNPRVPQAVSDVISKALSKDPVDRYPTTIAFAQALSAVIAAEPIGWTLPLPSSAPTEAVYITTHKPVKGPRQLRPIGIIVALLALLTIGIGGLVFISRDQPPPDRPAATIGLGANVIVQTPTFGAKPAATSAITKTSTVNADRCTPALFADTFDNPKKRIAARRAR